jgi:hypothetical protein
VGCLNWDEPDGCSLHAGDRSEGKQASSCIIIRGCGWTSPDQPAGPIDHAGRTHRRACVHLRRNGEETRVTPRRGRDQVQGFPLRLSFPCSFRRWRGTRVAFLRFGAGRLPAATCKLQQRRMDGSWMNHDRRQSAARSGQKLCHRSRSDPSAQRRATADRARARRCREGNQPRSGRSPHGGAHVRAQLSPVQ